MIIRNEERTIKERVAMREGPGTVLIKDVCSKEDLYGKGRLYAELILQQNCGVGYHMHENEEEIFMVKKGQAIYNDDGTEYVIKEGDVTICEDGHSHAITNVEAEECVVMALIILK
ncbi:MAG: cupin domain-containing protein [Erysipelotrichaceae bacterium]|nr:cupin domain-containing protein [Erysipelotrichaceae bacterium]